jgi:hypothetical protein
MNLEKKEINSIANNKTPDDDDVVKDVTVGYSDFAPKTFLEVLPGKAGTVFTAVIANIMAEGLTPEQQNILGNFVSAVGALISYRASRDELDADK